MTGVELIRAGSLVHLPHAFLGRRGGVSKGELAGLNVGYGSRDERAAIEENRRLAVASVLPAAGLATVYQVHSADAVYVDRPGAKDERARADAMVTDRPNLLLGILTADCAPVLFADEEAGIVGAAHAGWRGALAGVTDSTIAAMERLGARRANIRAAVGPCIGQPSYEVDEAFRERFVGDDPANARFFAGSAGGKPHFDLESYVVHRLLSAGLGAVEPLHLDTYSDEQRFYSYRRASHRGQADYGRQLSMIGLRG